MIISHLPAVTAAPRTRSPGISRAMMDECEHIYGQTSILAQLHKIYHRHENRLFNKTKIISDLKQLNLENKKLEGICRII